MMPLNTIERMERLHVMPEPNSGCWIWLGGQRNGYGVVTVNFHQEKVHRIFYARYNGTLEPDLVIDHKCTNRLCVNPNHLRQVTRQINAVENSTSPAAVNFEKAHCVHGHKFNASNTYRRKDRNGRVCTECRRRRGREYYARAI